MTSASSRSRVDYSTLERLAALGLRSVPDTQLRDLAEWCWDWAVTTGDARYAVLWRVLTDVHRWLAETEAVPTAEYEVVSGLLQEGIPEVLEPAEPATGALAAQRLASALSSAL